MTRAIAAQDVGDFADAVAGDAPTPGGGAVAGTVAALAAALVGMAGRYAVGHDPEANVLRELVERSDVLRARALQLADDDAGAYGSYLRAVRLPKDDPEPRRLAIRAALDASAEVPFALGGLAAKVAEAGERLATSGHPGLRSDACAAALLASAVATSTAVLVEENLRASPHDARVAGAVQHARDAAAAAERAVAASGSRLARAATPIGAGAARSDRAAA